MNSKRGSSAVFLMVILAGVISIALTLLYVCRQENIKSSADAVINLAGDSIMGEFEYDVQKEYGLFLIRGTDEELKGKMYNYLSYSFDGVKDVKLQQIEVSGSRFSVSDSKEIKKQIIADMKVKGLKSTAVSLTENRTLGTMVSKRDEKRTLRNGPTIVSLLSADLPKQSLTESVSGLIYNQGDITEAFKSGAEKYIINKYVLSHFNNESCCINDSHFFTNEVEYILAGNLSDVENQKSIERALKAMKFPFNLAHIYADADKKAAIIAMAEILTPGPAAVATQAVLASTWAYAESDNDVDLLIEGYKVPLVKNDTTWAVSLENAVEGLAGNTMIPAREEGFTYEEYLNIMLFAKNEEIVISRILDLVQINMRASHQRDFLIGEYSTGIDIRVKVNGKKYIYEKKY